MYPKNAFNYCNRLYLILKRTTLNLLLSNNKCLIFNIFVEPKSQYFQVLVTMYI